MIGPPHEAPQPTRRPFIAGIVAFFGLAVLALLWVVAGQVTTQHRMICVRAAATCTLTRRHLVGSETYQVRIPSHARAVVRVTPRQSRSAPRTFLELVDGSERTFLLEYEWSGAEARASAAATRVNAFLAGEAGAQIEEVEGSDWPARGLLAFVVALGVGSMVAWRSRHRSLGGSVEIVASVESEASAHRPSVSTEGIARGRPDDA